MCVCVSLLMLPGRGAGQKLRTTVVLRSTSACLYKTGAWRGVAWRLVKKREEEEEEEEEEEDIIVYTIKWHRWQPSLATS